MGEKLGLLNLYHPTFPLSSTFVLFKVRKGLIPSGDRHQPAQNGTAGDTHLESDSDSCHCQLKYCAVRGATIQDNGLSLTPLEVSVCPLLCQKAGKNMDGWPG